jgi:hypothetical protein
MQTYFISNGQAVKIGRAKDARQRLAALQIASPTPLYLLFVLEGDHEKLYHTRYAVHRLHGEWFAFGCGFYVWLMQQTERDDVIGDFALDAQGDRHFPCGLDDYYQIMNEISRHHQVCREARVAFARAYREWLRVQRRIGLHVGVTPRYKAAWLADAASRAVGNNGNNCCN